MRTKLDELEPNRDEPTNAPAPAPDTRSGLSRRSFLKAGGLLLALGASRAAAQTTATPPDVLPEPPPPPHVTPGAPLAPTTPVVRQYPGTYSQSVPFAPDPPPDPQLLHFFTPHEARTVDAIAARLIPGDDNDPGAREAGVVNYIDFALSSGDGFNEPIYRNPPFAAGYEDEPPAEARAFPHGVIWVPADELERYGYQSALTARDMFRLGIANLDRHANSEHGADFADLEEDEQDRILMALEDGDVAGFQNPGGLEFFALVREFTMQGMFSDPQYGGNRDLVGWTMIGYPGAQRAYTPLDMTTEGHDRRPQPMALLDHSHPGQDTGRHVVLPVFGSHGRHQHPAGGRYSWPYRPYPAPGEDD